MTSKNAEITTIMFPLDINESYQRRIPLIQSDDRRPIVVRDGYVPCHAFFNNQGLILWLYDQEIDTGLKRDDFPDCHEADIISNYDPHSGFLPESFIVLLPNEKMEELGFQVKTDEGWTWDPKKFESIEVKCSDKTKNVWCPATLSWEEQCDCERCKQSQDHPKYVNIKVIRDLYKNLPDHLQEPLDVGNPLADFANKCIHDDVNYCSECSGSFECEKSCVNRPSY